MPSRHMLVGLLLVVALGASAAAQTTWYVDDDAPNDPGPGDPSVSDQLEDGSGEHPFDAIQEGIDAAVDGDTVLVADGTYTGDGNHDLDFAGRAITVRSENGPEGCVIDCEGDPYDLHRGFNFHNGEGLESIVEGLAITNGYVDDGGGGVYCSSSSPTLTNCIISGNSATAYYGNGGGVYCGIYTSPTLSNCTISGNAATGSDGDGGGVYCGTSSSPTFTNCTIDGNSANGCGGGVYCHGSSPTLTNCTIDGNSASSGGGLYGSPTLANCTISGNAATGVGGAVHAFSPTLTNCTISGNSAGNGAAGIYCLRGSPTLINCTFSGNSADYGSGGIYCSISSPTLINCILWGDTPREIYVDSGSPVVNYCDVQGGWTGQGNTDADPLFIDPDGPDDDPNTWEDNDCRLGPSSPCIDAGDNTAVPLDTLDLDGDGDTDEPLPYDLDGRWRFVDDPLTDDMGNGNPPIVDMGAYEHQVWCVDDNAPNDPGPGNPAVSDPNENGSSDHPFDAIQEGIDVATGGDTVLVADGTYTGDGNRDLDFDGKPITVRSASGDPALSVIDCEGDGRGFHFHSSEGPEAVVDGLTITNGSDYWGGGVICRDNSSPTLVTCAITGNTADYSDGGGVYCTDSSPTLANCTISGNAAVDDGGAVYCNGDSSPTLINCMISGNVAAGKGGAVYCAESALALTNCTINGNSAGHGGAVWCTSNCSPTLTNCSLSANTADFGAALAVDSYQQSHPSTVMISNSILWNGAGQIWNNDGSALNVIHCDVQGGWIGEDNIDADPLFAFESDFHLMPGSPCIDAGTNDPVGGLPAHDPDGNVRPLDGDGDAVAIADMGAYEYDPASPSIALSPATCQFSGWQEDIDPPDQAVLLRNCGGGTLNWEIAGQPAWLTTSPASGESAGEVDQVTLSVDVTGLHGSYTAVLEIADPWAVNSPRELIVTLYVTDTLRVPSEYPTIQDAIDETVHGDVVEIADGTYTGTGNKNLDFGGKAIAVHSASGDPTLCIIDCESDGRGFYLHSGEGSDSIVAGLTIRNGSASYGGGGNCWSSSPTLTNCVISGNAATGSLGGGGVFCFEGNPTFINCTISGNSTNHQGGGVSCGNSSNLMLTNCTISRNSSASSGGGVYCYSDGSSVTLINCTISGNLACSEGGGVRCASDSTLINCTISENLAERGGGVSCEFDSSPTLTNCTISGNSANWDGGGIYGLGSTPTLTNCILWENMPSEIYTYLGDPGVTYCDVQGGWTGEGNFDADPLFVDPDGPDDDPNTWEDNDYRLSAGSPCIDAADNTAVPADVGDLDGDGDFDERIPFDLDGNPRFVQDPFTDDTGVPDPPRYRHVVDMGAYEYQFCFGDLDSDDVVGLADLAQLLGSYGQTSGMTYYDGDLDGDGDVDSADLAELLGVYGDVCE